MRLDRTIRACISRGSRRHSQRCHTHATADQFPPDRRRERPTDTRLTTLPTVRVVGHTKLVPLLHEGDNPHIAEPVASIPVEEIVRLTSLNDSEPTRVLSVSDGHDVVPLPAVAGTAACCTRAETKHLSLPGTCRGGSGSRGLEPTFPSARLVPRDLRRSAKTSWLVGGAGGNRTRVLWRRTRSSPGAVRDSDFLGPGTPTNSVPTGPVRIKSRSTLLTGGDQQVP